MNKKHPIIFFVTPYESDIQSINKNIPLPIIRKMTSNNQLINDSNCFYLAEKKLKAIPSSIIIAQNNKSTHQVILTQGEILSVEDGPMMIQGDYELLESLKKNLNSMEDYRDQKIVSIYLSVPEYDIRYKYLQKYDTDVVDVILDRINLSEAPSQSCDYVVQFSEANLHASLNEIMTIVIEHIK